MQEDGRGHWDSAHGSHRARWNSGHGSAAQTHMSCHESICCASVEKAPKITYKERNFRGITLSVEKQREKALSRASWKRWEFNVIRRVVFQSDKLKNSHTQVEQFTNQHLKASVCFRQKICFGRIIKPLLSFSFFNQHNDEILINVFGKLQNVDTDRISKTFTDKAFQLSAEQKRTN